MVRRAAVTSLVVVVLLVGFAPTVLAQEAEETQQNRYLGDRFAIRIIGGLVNLNTDVAAGRGLGALIDIEDLLGFDESITTFGIDGFWRFSANRKHALRLRYGNFDRSAYKAVSGTVPIFDVDFVGEIASEFINQVGILEYQYSFTNSAKTEAGISAGFAFYRYELALAGNIMIDNDPDQTEFRSERVGVVAPVPAVGFYVNQALRPNLILELRTSFIDLEIGAHNGRIFNTWGAITWFFTQHVGVGVGVSGSDIAYEKKTGDERLKVDIRQSTINFNLSFVF
jgi:hypothetical protein